MLRCDVDAGLADDHGDLELVVQRLGVGRVGDRVFVPVVVVGIRKVEDREFVPVLRHILPAVAVGGFDMGLEGVEVAQGSRVDGGMERHLLQGERIFRGAAGGFFGTCGNDRVHIRVWQCVDTILNHDGRLRRGA